MTAQRSHYQGALCELYHRPNDGKTLLANTHAGPRDVDRALAASPPTVGVKYFTEPSPPAVYLHNAATRRPRSILRLRAKMQIRQIDYFLALCEELNFVRAARRCRVSQPSLSNAIRALETELGGRLFVRQPRTRLSALGMAVRPHLRSVVEDIERARIAASGHQINAPSDCAVSPISATAPSSNLALPHH
jgi:hypothetical protein